MGSVGGMLYASLPPRPHTTYPQTMPVRPWSGAGQVGGPTVVAPVTGAAAAGGSRCCCAGSDGVPSASSMMVATPDGNAAASAEVTRQLQSKLQEAQQLYEQQQRLMQLHATGGPVAARSVTNVPMALLDELAQMSLDAQDHVSRQETPTPLYDDMPIRRGTPPLPAAPLATLPAVVWSAEDAAAAAAAASLPGLQSSSRGPSRVGTPAAGLLPEPAQQLQQFQQAQQQPSAATHSAAAAAAPRRRTRRLRGCAVGAAAATAAAAYVASRTAAAAAASSAAAAAAAASADRTATATDAATVAARGGWVA